MSETQPRTVTSPYVLNWLGAALLLGIMSATLFVVGMSSVDSSSSVCRNPDSSMGECLVATDQHRLERHLVTDGAVTLGVGALVCLAGAVVAGVVGNRRR